jgi:short-subunit dehydrogenase
LAKDLSNISPNEVKEIFDSKRYSIVINNAGVMKRGKFLQ